MKLGPVEALLARWIVPGYLREEFTGDLIEECSHHWREGHLHREARRWVRGELIASIPSMLSWRLRRGGKRAPVRWSLAGLCTAVATAQAWDSHVFSSTPTVMAMVLFAIGALALCTLFATSFLVLAVTWSVIVGVTVVARVISPIVLNELTLICMPFGMAYLCLWRYLDHAAARDPEPPAPAGSA